MYIFNHFCRTSLSLKDSKGCFRHAISIALQRRAPSPVENTQFCAFSETCWNMLKHVERFFSLRSGLAQCPTHPVWQPSFGIYHWLHFSRSLEKYWNQTERDHPNLSTKPWDSENSEGKFRFFLQRQIKERMVETCRKSNERQEFQNQAQLTSNAFIIHQRRERERANSSFRTCFGY